MVNWEEVDEIPDSEEEEGLDSQPPDQQLEFGPAASTESQRPSRLVHDVWDFPGSQHDGDSPGAQSCPAPPPAEERETGSVPSSPLSSISSEYSLSSTQNSATVRDPAKFKEPSTLEALEFDDPDGSRNSATSALLQSSDTPARSIDTPAASRDREQSAHVDKTRRLAVRSERSLRPRKPIQEHPYLLENAQYSNILKSHGLRPLRMTREAESAMDDDTRNSSQEETAQEVSRGSEQRFNRAITQTDRAQLAGNDNILHAPSSTPVRRSSMSDRLRTSSPPSSAGETDNTSLLDEDLPALDELLQKSPNPAATKARKRNMTPPSSSLRKRRRRNILHSDPVEPGTFRWLSQDRSSDTDLSSTLRQSQSPVVGPAQNSGPPAIDRSYSPAVSPAVTENVAEPRDRSLADSNVIMLSSDEGEGNPNAANDESDTMSENEESVIVMSRQIRGVLPASWLRLDKQAAREKEQQKKKTSVRSERASERDARRGIAHSRDALPGNSIAPLLTDDTDGEAEEPIPHDKGRTARSGFDGTGHTREPRSATVDKRTGDLHGGLEIIDDDPAVFEDNRIDYMLPSVPSRTRQMKLSDGMIVRKRRGRSSLDKFDKAKGPVRRRVGNHQTKITHLLRESELNDNYHHSPVNHHRDLTRMPHAYRAALQRTRSNQAWSPPQLSILDTIAVDAPRFLRIAARTARRRKNQGRSSPRWKSIQLATRSDQIDAASVLNDWRSGSIKQRDSVTAAMRRSKGRAVLKEMPGNRNNIVAPKPQPRTAARIAASQKFVRHVSNNGSIKYIPHQRPHDQPKRKQPRQKNARQSEGYGGKALRPAQLEVEGTPRAINTEFRAQKRVLDRLFKRTGPVLSSMGPSEEAQLSTESPTRLAAACQFKNTHQEPLATALKGQRRPRIRKSILPKRIDVSAPQYSHAKDPVPARYHAEPEPVRPNPAESRLSGLGPYGTHYTQHFEVFPLHTDVFFHESTLIGSGHLHTCATVTFPSSWTDSSLQISEPLRFQVFEWGHWDSRVSSEFGVLLDSIADQIHAQVLRQQEAVPPQSTTVQAASFVLNYAELATSFIEEEQKVSFVSRTRECLHSFNSRIESIIQSADWDAGLNSDEALRIYDRLLLVVLTILKICRADPKLGTEVFAMEKLLLDVADLTVFMLAQVGIEELRDAYGEFDTQACRGRGIRDDLGVMHSWVMIMKILEIAQIPRGSFWDLTQRHIAQDQFLESDSVRDHEVAWRNMFLLLPLVEFNDQGMMVAGQRHKTWHDGWIIPLKLLRRVFKLYKTNPLQGASFNNYCRALIGRCHYLVREWGWRKCVSIVGLIFDFFGGQNLAHLRNEEAFKSPEFLDNLAGTPTLEVESGDRCFHIFLKLIGVAILKSREAAALKDVGNLVARTTPNHNRQHRKEEKVLARDLAALRNHHDLLCTLFWAAPPEYRPAAAVIQNLVSPATSHKEACLINLQAWRQLARFVIASGEVDASWRPFHAWRTAYFDQVLHQFDSVASDVQLQLASLGKEASRSISVEMVRTTIAANKAAVMEVLHASAVASRDVVRQAPDLRSATFAINIAQLRTTFTMFSRAPHDSEGDLLRASLATVGSMLEKLDEFKAEEESQESEGHISNLAVADDAILVLDEQLSQSFFRMARRLVQGSGGKDGGVSSAAREIDSPCVEQVVMVAARLSVKFMDGGLMRLSSAFDKGKHQIFDGPPHQLDLVCRKYLTLFMATLLEHGPDDVMGSETSLLECWVLSLVKPQVSLKYELQLAHQLQDLGKPFVPDKAADTSAVLDYSYTRTLFECAIVSMRKSIREAGPSLSKVLTAEWSSTLKTVMESIKSDLRTMTEMPLEHRGYVEFVQTIIALIKVHASEFCAVDNFFYQISKEYSPSSRDPQLQVASLLSYGLRLQEGDARSSQPLFYLLFNNAKFSIVNAKLDEAIDMLRRAMFNQGVRIFLLSKMMPAMVNASFRAPETFPLVDMYAQVLRLYFDGEGTAHDLVDEDVPAACLLLQAVLEGIDHLQSTEGAMAMPQLHLLRQVIALSNLFWPFLHILTTSEAELQSWPGLWNLLSDLFGVLSAAEDYLRRFHTSTPQVRTIEATRMLFSPRPRQGSGFRAEPDAMTFAENIIQDARKGWKFSQTGLTICIQGIDKEALGPNASAFSGWDYDEVARDLYDRVQQWCWWWRRSNSVPCAKQALSDVF